MDAIIYRKSDRAIVGYAMGRQSPEAEILNIVNSELGGAAGDYASVLEAIRVGQIPTINPDLTVSWAAPVKPNDARIGQLQGKQDSQDLTLAELNELGRLRRGR